eukprot:13325084-Ditylum_brightwellii.AAC.1
MVKMIGKSMVMMMVLMMVLTVLRSTSHISHKLVIVVGRIEASKQNEHLVCNKDDDVDNGEDDSDDGADKHLTHLTQIKNNGNHN